jgi:predicted dehydrogenase
MVWFNYRRVPAIAFAKQLILEGRIGTVFHYRGCYQQQWGTDRKRPANWKMDPAQAGHGVVGDLLSHIVDLALFLNGPVREVSALTKIFAPDRKVEDAVATLVHFQNGSVGLFEATRFGIGYQNSNMFEIQGERGMLRFDLEKLNELEYLNAEEPRPLQGRRRMLITDQQHPYAAHFWKPGHIIGYEHTFIAALADFLFALAKNETFHPNFEDGLQTQLVLDAVLKSAESGKWTPVEI